MSASYAINSAALYEYNWETQTYSLIEGDVSTLQGPPLIDESPSAVSTTITTTGNGHLNNDYLDVGENVTTTEGDNGVYLGNFNSGGTDYLVFSNPAYNSTVYVTSASSSTCYPTEFETDDLDLEPLIECFTAGTLIATADGEKAVETLEIGDMLRTADGRAVPVKWIGHQTVSKVFTPTERFVPVRVTAGALGDGLPHTDLLLSGDHAMVVDGLAINASALVNGTSIRWEPVAGLGETITYYHVETDAHDVILANGAAAESFIDYVGRKAFDNYAEYSALYGEETRITEMSLPRISAARLVPAEVRARLAGQVSDTEVAA